MLEREHPVARPFGQRRAGDGPHASERERRPAVDEPRDPAPRTGVLAWALKSAALAGFVGLLAAQYLVRVSGPGEAPSSRVALAARGPSGDPETTGSIAGSAAARGTRLDPCALAGGSRPRT